MLILFKDLKILFKFEQTALKIFELAPKSL
jgi:hypothetical protein